MQLIAQMENPSWSTMARIHVMALMKWQHYMWVNVLMAQGYCLVNAEIIPRFGVLSWTRRALSARNTARPMPILDLELLNVRMVRE